MIKTTLVVRSNEPFSLQSIIYSHGWYDLPPFRVHNSPITLEYTLTAAKSAVDVSIKEIKKNRLSVNVVSLNPLEDKDREFVRKIVTNMLRLDETMNEFYSSIKSYSHLRWVKEKYAGRLLRSGALFEDTVKMICTTNCTWALTLIMVTNLCWYLGRQSTSGNYSFPVPESIAGQSENFLREKIKLGYRAPYVLELAENVASGKLDIESLRYSETSTEDLRNKLLAMKGIGPYAAAHLLKLIGRYDYLGIDSWSRKKYAEIYHNGNAVKDSTIERRYKKFGKWAGLVFWLEMTKEWHVK